MRPSVAILAAAILAMPARALAAEKEEPNRVAFRLDYTPRPGCMAREAFATALSSEFGYEVVQDDARALVRVEVKRNGAVLEAHVSARDERGVERWPAVIPSPLDCRELLQDAAYSIALNLGKWELSNQPTPEWLFRRPLPEVGTPAPSPRAREFLALVRMPPVAEIGPGEPSPSSEDSGVRWELGAAGLVVPYGLPAAGFGGGVSVGLRWRRFSIAGEMRGVASLVGDVGVLPASAVMWSGLVAPCLETHIRLSICGLVSIGRMYYKTDARAAHVDSRAVVGTLGLRIGYNWQPWTRLTVRPFVEGMLALVDGPLEAKQRGVVVSKQSPIGPLLGFGISLAFDVSEGK
jgi:hypothetical protein